MPGFPFDTYPDPISTAPSVNVPLSSAFAEGLYGFLRDHVSLAGGWWFDEAPEGTALPYGVVTEGDDDLTGSESAGHAIEPIGCQVSGFAADSRVAGRALMNTIAAAVTDPDLAVAPGYSLLHCRPANQHVELDPDKGPGGCDVWMAVVSVVALVGK